MKQRYLIVPRSKRCDFYYSDILESIQVPSLGHFLWLVSNPACDTFMAPYNCQRDDQKAIDM